jgi:hypothetical protein
VRGAQDLANDLHHALGIVEAERDQLHLDNEAMADSLHEFGKWLAAEHRYYAATDGPVARCLARVICRYEQIEGTR